MDIETCNANKNSDARVVETRRSCKRGGLRAMTAEVETSVRVCDGKHYRTAQGVTHHTDRDNIVRQHAAKASLSTHLNITLLGEVELQSFKLV